jgi:hypothetical protein
MPPRQKRKVSADTSPAQAADEPKTKRNTRNSASSAGDAWIASRAGAAANPVPVDDDNDSDFDEISDLAVPNSQLTMESQLSQQHLPENDSAEQMDTPTSDFGLAVNPAQPASPKLMTARSSPAYTPGRTFSPYNPVNWVSRASAQPIVHSSEASQGFIAHPDLCNDVSSAMMAGDLATQRHNIRGALNYHLKLMMMLKRNITTAERKALVQHLVSKAGLNPNEQASITKHLDNVSSRTCKAPCHLAKSIKHWSYLLRQLRAQFQAALQMFLNYPLAENWVQHTKTGIENWG